MLFLNRQFVLAFNKNDFILLTRRNFSIKEGKRKKRVNDKMDKSTSDQAVDPQTRLVLFKMINNGYLESVHGILSTGKEAVIVYADGGPGQQAGVDLLNQSG
jgi:serine/threonine-protein kinase RIO1